jgi:hypothetical protein
VEANELLRERITRNRSHSENPIASLHLGMCKAVGGYVPLAEFMELPIAVPFELMSLEAEANKEMQKKAKEAKHGH